MFKSRTEGSVVFYKCTVRLLEELDVLECEFQVYKNFRNSKKKRTKKLDISTITRDVQKISMDVCIAARVCVP